MHVSNGLKQFGRRTPDTNGASIVASTLITLLLFACAFVAMRTVGRFKSPTDAARERPVVVALTPPPPTVPARRPIPPPLTAALTTSTPRGAPAPPPAPAVAPRDTASAPSSNAAVAPVPRAPATIPFGISPVPSTLADTAMAARGGAPRDGAAVSVSDKTANTARFRDSVANARMSREIARAWMAHEATGREKQEIETSQRLAAKVAERATTAGSREVHIPQGKGMNGVGAVGGPSIGLPLFSSGPSAAQRRINDSLDAEYQLRLRRLQDRIIARRDSARLDSLRRDSLARRSRSPIPDSRSAVAPSLVQRPLQLSPP